MFFYYYLCDFNIILHFYKKTGHEKLYEKVKTIREEKKLSQDFMAHELSLSQSQYSRRERGDTIFNTDETLRLSKSLDVKVL